MGLICIKSSQDQQISESKQWDYKFFVDFEGNIDDPRVMNALRGIQEEAKSIKLLGNY